MRDFIYNAVVSTYFRQFLITLVNFILIIVSLFLPKIRIFVLGYLAICTFFAVFDTWRNWKKAKDEIETLVQEERFIKKAKGVLNEKKTDQGGMEEN